MPLDSDSVLILGAGGHAKGVVQAIEAEKKHTIYGFTSPQCENTPTELLGYPIVGDDSVIASLAGNAINRFIIGMGAVGNNAPRQRLYELGRQHGLMAITSVHPGLLLSATVLTLAQAPPSSRASGLASAPLWPLVQLSRAMYLPIASSVACRLELSNANCETARVPHVKPPLRRLGSATGSELCCLRQRGIRL